MMFLIKVYSLSLYHKAAGIEIAVEPSLGGSELSVLITVLAVILVPASVGIRANVIYISERHTAALAKSLFLFHNLSKVICFKYHSTNEDISIRLPSGSAT